VDSRWGAALPPNTTVYQDVCRLNTHLVQTTLKHRSESREPQIARDEDGYGSQTSWSHAYIVILLDIGFQETNVANTCISSEQ